MSILSYQPSTISNLMSKQASTTPLAGGKKMFEYSVWTSRYSTSSLKNWNENFIAWRISLHFKKNYVLVGRSHPKIKNALSKFISGKRKNETKKLADFLEFDNHVAEWVKTLSEKDLALLELQEKETIKKQKKTPPKNTSNINKDDAQESLTAYYIKYLFTSNVATFKQVDYTKLSQIKMGSPALEKRIVSYKDIRSLGGEFEEGGKWDQSAFKQIKAFKTKITNLSSYEIALDAKQIKDKGKDLHNQAARHGTKFKGKRLPFIGRSDKFSTADIFVVSTKKQFKDLMSLDNIFDYVQKLQELYHTKELIGISLKEISSKFPIGLAKEVNVIRDKKMLGRQTIGQPNDKFKGVSKYFEKNSNKVGDKFFSNQGYDFKFDKTHQLYMTGEWSPTSGAKASFSGHGTAPGINEKRGARIGGVSGGTVEDLLDIYSESRPNTNISKIPKTNDINRMIKSFMKDKKTKVIDNKSFYEIYVNCGGKLLKSEKEFIEDFDNGTSSGKEGKLVALIYLYYFFKNESETGRFLRFVYNYVQASHDYGGAPYIKLY